MNLYQTITLEVTDPESGKKHELKLFGLAGTDVRSWEQIFKPGHNISDILKTPFKISKPLDIKEISAFDGFTDFISALEDENP